MLIVLSLFTLYLFLIGYAAAPSLAARDGRLERVALTLGTGLLINYCLVLTGQPLRIVFLAGSAVAICGVFVFVRDLRGGSPFAIGVPTAQSILIACGVLYLLVTYYCLILSEPIKHWDARSIWFFHAKMIWAAGGLNGRTGMTHPSVEFSGPDYPNLIPAMAAQLMYAKGYWNEFLPKGSLFVALVPLVLWVFSFRKAAVSFVLLVAMVFCSLDRWLSNGYMDGYFIMYSAVALLSFGRYFTTGRNVDLCSGVCAAGISANLKNEGLLFVVCLLVAVLLASVRHRAHELKALLIRVTADSTFARVLTLSIAPTVMWTTWTKSWGLRDHLAGHPAESVARLAARLADGSSPQYLFTFLTTTAAVLWLWIVILVVTAAFRMFQRRPLPTGTVVAALTSMLYFSGLYVSYLSTPIDLGFHLQTSAVRTMAGVSVGLFVSIYFLLSALETNE